MRKQAVLIFYLTPLLLTVLLAPVNAQSETYRQKTYGGKGKDTGFSIQQTSDGEYIIAGVTNSFGAGGDDFYLVKLERGSMLTPPSTPISPSLPAWIIFTSIM